MIIINKVNYIKKFIIISLFLLFFLTAYSSGMLAAQGDPFNDIQQKLSGISDSEKEALEKLFVLVQEIEEAEREEAKIAGSISALDKEVKNLEEKIKSEECKYTDKKGDLEQVLKSYQKQGPGSFLEIVLDSENLTMLIRRLSILQEITHNTGELLEQIKASKKTLEAQEEELSDKLEAMNIKNEQMKESIAVKLKLKNSIEEYIGTLGEQKEYTSRQLSNLKKEWDAIKPIFAATTKAITKKAEKGELPMEALKTTFDFFSIIASIDEKSFNEIFSSHSDLPKMEFAFYPAKTEIRMPENNLILTGTFIIQKGHTIKFEAKEGSFYGLPLEESSIEALFSEGYLLLDLSSLMGDFVLHSVEIKEDNLEFVIKPVIFK